VSDARDLRAAAVGELALRLPARWLEEYAVLPLAIENGALLVAADGVLSPLVSDALSRTLGATPQAVPFPAADIRAALVAAPRASLTQRGADDPLRSEAAESLDDLRALASREPVVQVVNAMLAEAVRAGASDIHVESVESGLRVRLRLDGVLHDAQQLGLGFQAAVISRLKVLAGLDIAERRLPQDGRTRVRIGARELDIRVSTLPALHGESLVLRLLDGGGGAETRRLEELGMAPAVLESVTRMLARSSGLVLVTGPTGSGKTTTLYAALAERSTPGVKVVTVEDPVEYRLDGVVQLPVNLKAGFGFANALRAILRHDPDVILVGEMRDTETAEIAVQAALTGHLVLSTLHTTDAAGALPRLVEMGIPSYLLAATLHGVLAQRLVRTVCDACAATRDLTTEERALVGAWAPQISRVREGAGCAQCAGTGYRGRAAISELLLLDDAMRTAFVAGASLEALRTLARNRGVASLRDDGWRLVLAGRTTIAEVARVVSEDEAP
jgi:type II secretory ATPase GspE/PulE/Tfp pilus assembly ATPase PilB-like protein